MNWNKIEDSDPQSVPQKAGNYLVAAHGGYVGISFFMPNLKFGQGRAEYGKYGRNFEAVKLGYKITHWADIPAHPEKLKELT